MRAVFLEDSRNTLGDAAPFRAAQTRLEAALTAGGIGTWDWDLVNERIVADANLARLFSVSPEEAAGGGRDAYLRAIYPDDRPRVAEAIEDAVAHREIYAVEYRVVLPDGSHRWLASRGRVERDSSGRAVALPGVTVDITDQAERGLRDRFLAELAERARGLTEPDEVIADAVRSVGMFLGVARCVFAVIDIAADTCTVSPDYCADASVTSMAGTFPISDFGPYLVAEYDAGRTVVADDLRRDPARFPAAYVGAYGAVGIRAFVAVPVLHSSRLVSVIAAHSATPRHWLPEEVALLQTVVERTWLTVEVTRQNRALAREAEDRREDYLRTERILASITDAFFTLDAEWRFTYVNDSSERIMARKREDLLGKFFWDEFPATVGAVFEREFRRAVEEQVAVSFEEHYAPLDVWVEVRAYPSPDGLSVFYQDVSARKRVEQERERLAERERNIARQLQAALTPSIPERIPGLALAKYYEAALAEAGVGGDFYDVFPVEKGCTALVVGDLSGKGLAAATQVATVRNMLRYALYRSRTLAGALESLNALLAEQGLLTGFATLFVGAYDSGAGTLTYVNCGQEPALLRRAGTGRIEELSSTGPVIGTFAAVTYAERTVPLAPGDAVAVFTDGLTEVGPSRAAMLGVEGVAALLEEAVTGEDAAQAAEAAEAERAEALLPLESRGRTDDLPGHVGRDALDLLHQFRQAQA